MKPNLKTIMFSGFIEKINRKDTSPDWEASVWGIISLIREKKSELDEKIKEFVPDLLKLTNQVRSCKTKQERTKLKVNKLPYILPSGIFRKRESSSLTTYSSIICIDVDDVNDPDNLKDILYQEDAYFLFCFTSPSGNGLKVFFAVSSNVKNHKKYYEAYANHLGKLFDMDGTIDSKCKDVARACFLCYDPDLVLNPKLEKDNNWWPKPIKLLPVKKQGKLVVNVKKQEHDSDSQIDDDIFNNGAYQGKLEEAEAILDFLSKEGKSITENYDQWYLVAYALHSTFSEKDGMRLYMSFCELDGEKHDAKKSDKKWKYCKENNRHEVGFGTIIYFAQRQGYVSIKKRYPATSFSIHSDFPFCRVGSNWYKIYSSRNAVEQVEEKIIPFKRIEVFADVTKKYFYDLLRFDEFTNLPAFDGSYRRVHGNRLNISSPLNIIPNQGHILNSIKMLKRMFDGEGDVEHDIEGDIFTIILDYLCILFQNPTQKLPALILVSKANGTGKTTFLNWLRVLLGNNMTIIGNDQIRSRFNSTYINSLVVGVDESFLERDKRIEKERIKQLITAYESFSESKGVDASKIESHVKFIFCSNDEERVIYVEKEETRWLIVNIPELLSTNTDPDMKKKLIDEAPAFLYLLLNRKIYHERKDRLWFASNHLKTDAFKRLVKNTRPPKETLIRDVIVAAFELAVDKDILKISSTDLVRAVNRVARYKIEIRDVKAFMRDNDVEYLGASSPSRSCWPYTDEHEHLCIRIVSGRCWLLNRSDWIEDEEDSNVKD